MVWKEGSHEGFLSSGGVWVVGLGWGPQTRHCYEVDGPRQEGHRLFLTGGPGPGPLDLPAKLKGHPSENPPASKALPVEPAEGRQDGL